MIVVTVKIGGRWFFRGDEPPHRAAQDVCRITVPDGSSFAVQGRNAHSDDYAPRQRALALASTDGQELVVDAATLVKVACEQAWQGTRLCEANELAGV